METLEQIILKKELLLKRKINKILESTKMDFRSVGNSLQYYVANKDEMLKKLVDLVSAELAKARDDG